MREASGLVSHAARLFHSYFCENLRDSSLIAVRWRSNNNQNHVGNPQATKGVMKTMRVVLLAGLLVMAPLIRCVVHEHRHHRHKGGHVHGSGCGHELRGGVWITVPVIEIR